MTFRELLNNPQAIHPGKLQEIAKNQFPVVVENSNFQLRLPNSPIPSKGIHIIIGVASYSQEELQLLDAINVCLFGKKQEDYSVTVFDMLSVKDMKEIVEYIPPLTVVHETPIVSIWENGESKAEGRGIFTIPVLQQIGLMPYLFDLVERIQNVESAETVSPDKNP